MPLATASRGRALKRFVLAAGAALALGGAAAGVVGAQQGAGATPTPGTVPGTAPGRAAQVQQRYEQYLATLAAKLGVSVDKLKQAMAETKTELGLPDRGPGKHGRPGNPPGPWGVSPATGLAAAAKAIGVTTEQLRQELPGKSLADVARAHNVDPARVADALKAEARARIDQAAAAGRITAAQAAEMKQRTDARIDQMLTRQVPAKATDGPGRRRAASRGTAS